MSEIKQVSLIYHKLMVNTLMVMILWLSLMLLTPELHSVNISQSICGLDQQKVLLIEIIIYSRKSMDLDGPFLTFSFILCLTILLL